MQQTAPTGRTGKEEKEGNMGVEEKVAEKSGEKTHHNNSWTFTVCLVQNLVWQFWILTFNAQ